MNSKKQKGETLVKFGLSVLLDKLIEHEDNAINAYVNAHAAEESRRDFIAFLLNWIEAYAQKRVQEERVNISIELMQLDWIKILNEAIKMRESSWNDNPVREWRNASDEICGAVLRAMKMTLSDNLNSNLEQNETAEQKDN
jgi:hypothetical protein